MPRTGSASSQSDRHGTPREAAGGVSASHFSEQACQPRGSMSASLSLPVTFQRAPSMASLADVD